MPYKKRAPRKRAPRRRLKPAKSQFRQTTAKYQLSNKVELLRPITLKPKSVMKKFIYYNTCEIKNQTFQDLQQCQFQTNYINSMWILQSDTYTDQNTNQWNWNKSMSSLTGTPTSGTSFPGFVDNPSAIGFGYQNNCIVGAKITITAQPLFQPNSASGSPTALFAIVQPNANTLTGLTTIDDLYASPFCQMRKIEGGGMNDGSLSGNTKSASIVLKYSPKKYNNIKDIRDNGIRFNGHINQSGTTGEHPQELDRITFGVVNVLSNPSNKRPCVSVMLQYKHEVTVLFTEPFNNQNQYPAAPQPVILG